MARKSISKRVRFEVFKRDCFACQYCGRKAPDVLLHIDHIIPVSEGGKNDLLNLVTSCAECNLGKSNRVLSDKSVVERKRQQLADLQQRREQLEMMFEWQESLTNMQEDTVERLSRNFTHLFKGHSLNTHGIAMIRRALNRFSIDEIMESMRVASSQYLEYDSDGNATHQSVEHAFAKLLPICGVNRAENESPGIKRLFYIRGILRKRLRYLNEVEALDLLKRALALNASVDSLEAHAKETTNWNVWEAEMKQFINNQLNDKSGGHAE